MALPDIESTSNLQQIPGVMTPQNSPTSFGLAIGEGLQRTAQDIEHVRGVLQARQNQQMVDDLTVKMNDWTSKSLYGEQNPDGSWKPGLLQKRGDDAVGITRQYHDSFKEMSNEVTQNMPAQQRIIAQRVLNDHQYKYVNWVTDHEATQSRNGQYLSAKNAASSIYDAGMAGAMSDDVSNDQRNKYARQEQLLSRWENRPTDVKAALEKYDIGRVTTLINQGTATTDQKTAMESFLKAEDVIANKSDLNDEQRSKLDDMVKAKRDAWLEKANRSSKLFASEQARQQKEAVKQANDSVYSVVTHSLLDDKTDLHQVAEMINTSPDFAGADEHIRQEQVEKLLTASKNRAKPAREFPAESNHAAFQQISGILYSNPGKAMQWIEDACSHGELSSANYTALRKEASAKRTDQVNRALQEVVPKFWELDAERGIKPKAGQDFYYTKSVVEPGTPDYKAGYGEKPGWAGIGRSYHYEKATPQQLEKVVEGVKRFCIEHPEADTDTVIKTVLRPHRLAAAMKNLDERLPLVLPDFLPVTQTQGPSK